MNLTESELEKLKSSKSAAEWNANCDAIKKARGGQYPPDWYAVVLATGLIETVSANFTA